MILSYLVVAAVVSIQIWYWDDKNGHKDEIEASEFSDITIRKIE